MGDKNQTRVILIVKKIGSLLESSMGVGMEGSTMVRVLLLWPSQVIKHRKKIETEDNRENML